jgi:hypothetical protein
LGIIRMVGELDLVMNLAVEEFREQTRVKELAPA